MKVTQTNTLAQAKKNALRLFIVTIAISALFLIVGIILVETEVLGLLGIIMIVGGVLGIPIAVWLYFYELKRAKRSFCPACGAKYDYNNDINWSEMDRVTSGDKVVSKIQIECRCPSCGRTDEYFQKFTIARYDKNKGQWSQQDVRTLMRNYFIK